MLRPAAGKLTAVIGTLVHAPIFGEMSVTARGAVLFDSDGLITSVLDQAATPELALATALQARPEVEHCLDYGDCLITPGLIDAHCHAPQYVFTGTGMDLPLLAWLEKYTFPCEARFEDVGFARLAYGKAVRRHLSLGASRVFMCSSLCVCLVCVCGLYGVGRGCLCV